MHNTNPTQHQEPTLREVIMTEFGDLDREIEMLQDRRRSLSVFFNLAEPETSPAPIVAKPVVVPRPAPKLRPKIESRPVWRGWQLIEGRVA